MKKIGTSGGGGTIVELTELEARTLARAEVLAEGGTFVWGNEGIQDKDLSKVFIALNTWLAAKLHVNELQELVDRLNRSLAFEKPTPITQDQEGTKP